MKRIVVLLMVLGSATFVRAQPANRQAKQRQLLRLYGAHSFEELPYRLLKPIGFKAGEKKKYPLILSLHGAGGKGSDNKKNLRNWNGYLAEDALRRKHPCFVAAPQTPGPWTVPGGEPEFTEEAVAKLPVAWQKWVRRRQSRGAVRRQRGGDLPRVFKLLDALAKEYPIDISRVYVLGHSMGGFGTWNALLEAPERFAAGIPTAGGAPPWKDLRRIVDIPIWTFHGDNDPTVSVELTRYVFGELKKQGANTKYTEIRGVKHAAAGVAFRYEGDDAKKGMVTKYASDRCDKTGNIWDWLFAQKKKSTE